MKLKASGIVSGIALIALCGIGIYALVSGREGTASAGRYGWSAGELSLIRGSWTPADRPDSLGENPLLMRVLTVSDAADSAVLRLSCDSLGTEELLSPEFDLLCEKMLATVNDPTQNGVGIAGPQVGICRRIVAVMRYDKEGRPFEVYPNIRIIARRGEVSEGPEGCLSVPGWRGMVPRWPEIDIRYSVVEGCEALDSGECGTASSQKGAALDGGRGEKRRQGSVRDTVETVSGYTAIIFQHECDHLDGVLYTDRASSLEAR